ncbi:MAG TPA: tRNA epoxyqueuosine(34) reductase QueG [Gemmataceae bacterium]|jgi:epoxyqueuosine reductase
MRTPADHIKDQARALGFALAGVARAAEADGFARLREWLARGYAGEMAYMGRYADARRHPAAVLPQVRSVVMVGMEYAEVQKSEVRGQKSGFQSPPTAAGGSSSPRHPAKVARYARGADYHDVLRDRLNRLLAWVRAEFPGTSGRGVVDTAPLLERDFARRAGLGWIGKNTMLINKHRGSYFFLGALLLDLDLDPDPPHAADHCGTCTACLDACPTGAFAGPGWLDARKCISYLTIELRSPVPQELRPGVGDWLFGCDVCQEVCPWNRKDGSEPEAVDAAELLALTEDQFRERYRGTALFRTKRRGLLRNAALVLGNTGDERALPALRRALEDAEPLVRDAASWAIERIAGRGD